VKDLQIMAYTTTGREFEAMDDLDAIGIDRWRGTRIEFERRGKSRVAEPYSYPALPNYIWITAPHHRLADVMDVRHISRTVKFMTLADVASWQRFQREAEARLAEAQGIIERRKIMEAASADRQQIINLMAGYKRGDTLKIDGGAFAGMLATFSRMVINRGERHPMIEAEIEMFGGKTTAAIDALHVRRAG
jgi:transcription antitermination factor NusG